MKKTEMKRVKPLQMLRIDGKRFSLTVRRILIFRMLRNLQRLVQRSMRSSPKKQALPWTRYQRIRTVTTGSTHRNPLSTALSAKSSQNVRTSNRGRDDFPAYRHLN